MACVSLLIRNYYYYYYLFLSLFIYSFMMNYLFRYIDVNFGAFNISYLGGITYLSFNGMCKFAYS